MASHTPLSPKAELARAVRERFLAQALAAMGEIADAVLERLTTLMDEPSSARDNQIRRDVWMSYKRARPLWLQATNKVWRECLAAPLVTKDVPKEAAGLQLVGAEVVENKILASRMVLAVMEKVSTKFEDLRIRIRLLEESEDLRSNDLFRPEVLVLQMVEQWANAGMPNDSWPMVNEVVQALLKDRLAAAYESANATLIAKGVLPTIALTDRVKAVQRAPSRPRPAPSTPNPEQAQPHEKGPQPIPMPDASEGAHSERASVSGAVPSGAGGGGLFGGRLGWRSAAQKTPDAAASAAGSAPGSASAPFWKQSGGSGAPSGSGASYGTADETRMMTAVSPLARARSRAQGVIGQIRRMFVNQGAGDFARTSHHAPSPALAAAMAPSAAGAQPVYATGGTLYEDYSPAGVARVADGLREQSADLKRKAETKAEKATIEIVALMFQAIISEERIPPGIRVWFSRLQMPVLRVALEDPDFLGSTAHPARLLIDRMGSCVMGFDSTGVQGAAMEAEVKRIVQVVEQYPETGKKVYQIVYDEFQKFLAKFLTERGPTQKVVSVAQQVEQRETLTIQYTIEMRNMLKELPVRDEIRDFLFKIWAEVMAVATVRKGPQHADTLMLKKAASDLVWSASAKPNRADRARVIQDLPNLLLRLRSGMTLLSMPPSAQDKHVKVVSDTLADAFLSKTQAIAQGKIDALAQRLGHLEDFLSEEGMGDLPLDGESIEMMMGIDASAIDVITDGGSKPTAAMLAWAQELELGSWFTLDHNKQIMQVQFAWRSDRKHLNLFAATSGKTFLIQAGRLASYLQAGLLLPQEEESLTVRATRDAMAKLEANPALLLS